MAACSSQLRILFLKVHDCKSVSCGFLNKFSSWILDCLWTINLITAGYTAQEVIYFSHLPIRGCSHVWMRCGKLSRLSWVFTASPLAAEAMEGIIPPVFGQSSGAVICHLGAYNSQWGGDSMPLQCQSNSLWRVIQMQISLQRARHMWTSPKIAELEKKNKSWYKSERRED